MKNKQRFIFFLMSLSIVLSNSLNAQVQAYIRLEDASGWNTDAYQPLLEPVAQNLIQILPEELQDSFKVFDFGFYLLQETFTGGFPAVFQQKINEVSNLSPYYLLFGKQSDSTGVYTKFWMDLKLPKNNYPCLTEDAISYLSLLIFNKLVSVYEKNQKKPDVYYLAEIEAIKLLGTKLFKLIDCCQVTKNQKTKKLLETCDNTYDIDELAAYLVSLGVYGVAYCKICDVVDTYTTGATTFISNGEKIRCIFGEIQADNTIRVY